jgi:apolipoprotein N-acyltransferase
MIDLASKISNLSLKNKYLLSCFCGSLTSLALAPVNFLFVLFITFPLFILIIDSQKPFNKKILFQLFTIGWSFGFGYSLFGLYWINIAFLNDISSYYIYLPIAVIISPLLIGLFYGFIPLIASLFYPNNTYRLWSISVSWTFIEYVKGDLFNFPWNQIGHTLININPILQITSIFGELSLTLLVVYIASFPVILFKKNKKKLYLYCLPVALLIIIYFFGYQSINLNKTSYENIDLLLVQPNVDQKIKWLPSHKELIIEKIFNLSNTLSNKDDVFTEKYIIWPETALPILIDEDDKVMDKIISLLNNNTFLLTGAVRRERDNKNEFYKYYNSFFIINENKQILDKYDKRILVPFGEYIPFSNFVDKFTRFSISGLTGSFSHGTKKTINTSKNFSVLICYEIIFSGRSYSKEARPDWVLNITNDAWFGRSPGPYQHLAMAKVRAVEEGLPVIRVANTGISAIIDPKGRVLKKLSLEESGIIESKLPKKIDPTFYSQHGKISITLIMMVISIFIYYMHIRRVIIIRKKNRKF